MGFLVRHAGTCSLFVDLGRPHTRSLGVAVGGAADRAAYQLGNALVGNSPDAVALEMTLLGPRLEATETHGLAIFGAYFGLLLNEEPMPLARTFTVHAGDALSFQPPQHGLRAYLCVAGGFSSRLILGSRSALEPIKEGQTLECPPSRLGKRFVRLERPRSLADNGLRVLPGTHANLVGAERFVAQAYRVLPTSNRMGLRLEGRKPLPTAKEELLSAPVCPGTVQVTHNGQPIVLGMDGQTIGGYPRVAQVISADLDLLAQLRPGDAVRFQWVDLVTAQAAWHEHRAWLREWLTRLSVTAEK
jgi:5-oxoprolinase (ATP-hydrolysing) subunit C